MSKSFDQIVQGSIDIKKQSKQNKYKITVCTNDPFLKYQVWSSDKTVNSSRSVYQQSANDWVNQFNELNASLKASNKPLFSPTTIMELGNDKYVFVIHKAQINENGNMVFSVLTNEINLLGGTSKKMIKLPCGQYDGVRFDIDSTTCGVGYYYNSATNLCTARSTFTVPIVYTNSTVSYTLPDTIYADLQANKYQSITIIQIIVDSAPYPAVFAQFPQITWISPGYYTSTTMNLFNQIGKTTLVGGVYTIADYIAEINILTLQMEQTQIVNNTLTSYPNFPTEIVRILINGRSYTGEINQYYWDNMALYGVFDQVNNTFNYSPNNNNMPYFA